MYCRFIQVARIFKQAAEIIKSRATALSNSDILKVIVSFLGPDDYCRFIQVARICKQAADLKTNYLLRKTVNVYAPHRFESQLSRAIENKVVQRPYEDVTRVQAQRWMERHYPTRACFFIITWIRS